MERSTTDKRLDDLSHKVDQGFERVDLEMRALRAESRAEFAAFRNEMKEQAAGLRNEMKEQAAELRSEMKAQAAELRSEMKAQAVELRGESAALRLEMNAGFDAVQARFDGVQRLMIQFCGGLLGTLIVACASFIATQL